MKIKIKTLTPVHVGSGETLQYGNDFVIGKVDGYKSIGIVDANKVLNIIGEGNITAWVRAIDENKPTDEIVNRYRRGTPIADYCKRIIDDYTDTDNDTVNNTDTLKEQIIDGRGIPYIPGSSIKGAMRTAVLASNSYPEREFLNGRGRPNAKEVESTLFGEDPNSNIFRFLQVGDAFFGENFGIATRAVNINERERRSYWDKSKSQLIESIGSNDESSFNLKLNLQLYEIAKDQVHLLPACMESVPALFELINGHTIELINQEISTWEKKENADSSEKVSTYVDRMSSILNAANECDKSSCVLRIGYGSGWRFITGAWTERYDSFYGNIVPAARPQNNRYGQYVFPKTRKVDTSCDLFGFVKLTSE